MHASNCLIHNPRPLHRRSSLTSLPTPLHNPLRTLPVMLSLYKDVAGDMHEEAVHRMMSVLHFSWPSGAEGEDVRAHGES